MAKRITKDQENVIIESYKSGNSMSNIASLIGISHSSVSRVLKRNNI